MKVLMLCALGLVVLGGVYHEELARAWSQSGSSGSVGGVTGSMGGLGSSMGSTLGGAGNSFGQ